MIQQKQLDKSLQGYNFTLFCYGITSSGKTYTQVGNVHQQGLIPLSISYILRQLQNESEQSDIKHLIYVSYFEIYNEQIQDLIKYSDTPLQIIERQGAIDIRNLSKHSVNSIEQIKTLFNIASQNRSTASTAKNETSSRSHSIFQVLIQKLNTETRQITQFKINFCDLAGSERVLDQEAQIRRREGVKINLSLSALTNVIKQLTENQQGFINYRQSKLTHVLKDALGGNSYTTIICNVTLASLYQQETIQTLRFGQMAKKIVNNIHQCQYIEQNVDQEVLKKKIQEMEEELEKLKMNKNLNGKDKLQQLLRQGQKNINKQVTDSNAEFIRNEVSKNLKEVVELQNQLQEILNQECSYQQLNAQILFYKQQTQQLKEENQNLSIQLKTIKKINYEQNQKIYEENIKLLEQYNQNIVQHTEIQQKIIAKINKLNQEIEFNEGIINKFIPQQYLQQILSNYQ